MNSRTVVLILLSLVGIPMLIMIGQWSATDPLMAGLATMGVVMAVAILMLGRFLWMLIPLFFYFEGSINVLPGGLAPRQLVISFVVPILCLHWVARRFPLKPRFGALELALLAQFLMLGQAYLRNPVGFAAFGTEIVGGRPYFELGFALILFVVIGWQVVDSRKVRQAMWMSFIGGLLMACYEAVTGLFPQTAMRMARYYQGVTTTTAIRGYLSQSTYGAALDQGVQRLTGLKFLPGSLFPMLFARFSPLEMLKLGNLWAVLVAVIALVAALLSGFRSQIVWIALIAFAAMLVRRRGYEVMVFGLIAVPVLAILLIGQGTLFELPFAAQRALSFLPADWDEAALRSAEGTLEWRFEMWEQALKSERYIENKMLGDGYGFSLDELAYQQQLQLENYRSDVLQEYYLMTGQYHSGPIETIRRVGYVGLLVLTAGFVVVFNETRRVINRTRGSDYYMPALFIGLPMLIFPFFFWLIYGEFQSAVTQMCFASGFLRLIDNSMEAYPVRVEVRKDELAPTTGGIRPNRLPQPA